MLFGTTFFGLGARLSVLRFLGFELDQERAELRGPDGFVVKIRLRSLELLKVLATNPGRVLSKQELMEAVWPDVHVGEDSLFQSIREIRTALSDDQRQIIKLMSGRGYLFAAAVSSDADMEALAEPHQAITPETIHEPASGRRSFNMGRRAALVALAGLGVISVAATAWSPWLFSSSPVTVAIMPMASVSNDPPVARMAANVTRTLTDGLAKIEDIRVLDLSGAAKTADYVVTSELEKTESLWKLRARMTESATGAVKWTMSLTLEQTNADAQLQQTRLTAGIGHPLALRLNALLKGGARAAESQPVGTARIAVEQATASINHTTPERYGTALAILEKALTDDPGNVDLQVVLAAFQLRGIQMAWFPIAERETTEKGIGLIMERALSAHPDYVPVLQTQCRFLSTTHRFVESLVVCGKALTHDPWDGTSIYLMGLAQIFLGRFDDALASFQQANQFDTPQVSRWTWAIGAGWTYLLMGRAEEAVPWLQRSIAITSASGRTHMLLAAAYQQLGRNDDARAMMAMALEVRPGSTARNMPPPTKNNSAIYLKASEQIIRLMVAAGLPE